MIGNQFTEAVKRYSSINGGKFLLKAIFFDMDGVLFDSMPLHARSWIKTFKKYGIEIPEHEPYMNEGSTAYYTINKMFRKYQNRSVNSDLLEQIRMDKHQYMASLPPAGTVDSMPEFVNFVAENNIDCWVVTGSAQKNLIDRLNMVYNGHFERNKMVTAHDVKIGKPHPEPYLMALQKSGYHVGEVMVIENAPLGVESAKAAGLFTVAVNTGPINRQVLLDAGADVVFDEVKQLLDCRELILKT
ncbi:MAG: HAD family phosphatase [Prolixibacteraceae bacterium]|nr:HAD family phosphatase [Prolixibacteraceae bacterium]MBN2648229.1 HAD family phosphatase [Prolixibacteraceae bacterium]